MATKTNCPLCGKLADPNLEHCPHCGGPMRDALVGSKQAPQKEESQEHCPSCNAVVREGDIICVRCGTNLLTGQKIAKEQEEEVRRERNWTSYYIVAAVLVLALALLGGGAYFLLQDPVKEAIRLAEQENNHIEAINVLRAYVDKHPERADAQLVLGKLYWLSGTYELAADAFETAFETKPAMLDAGRLAVMAAGKIPGDTGYQRQVATLRTLAQNDPDDAETQRLLALALGMQGDLEGEAQALEEAVKRAPADAAAYRYLGVSETLAGDYAAAETALSNALRLDRGTGDTAAAQGFLASMADRNLTALAELENATKRGSSIDAYAKCRLGLLYMDQGDFERAIGPLTAAQNEPRIASTATFYRALCLKQSGVTQQAQIEFDRLLTGDTEYAGQSAVQLALIFMETRDLKRADEMLKRAAQLGQTSALYHTAQGQWYSQSGQIDQARRSFSAALRQDPNYPAAYLEQGLLDVGRGVQRDGIRSLERYLELAGENAQSGRVNEIKLLVDQLKQSLDSNTGTTEVVSRQSAR